MANLLILGLLVTAVGILAPASAEKQIKLEDIEKDNLKAAQQAKLEKQLQQQYQYQQYQQQHQQQQQQPQPQPALHYEQQFYTPQELSAYSQYILPQQYVQQQHQQQQQQQFYSGYSPLAGNSLTAGYTSASSVHPFQAYYTPQLASAVGNLQGSGAQPHLAASAQTQPLLMALSSPSLAGLQQAYYQVLPKAISSLGNVQYVPGQSAQYYYQPQASAAAAPSPYTASQQYVPAFQPLPAGNKLSAFQQSFVSTAPQTFSSATSSPSSSSSSSAAASDASFSYPSQSAAAYNSDQPTFVTLKAPQHLVASPGQQQQYLQSQTPSTTASPFKYLNSPQYLAQNYNTIQSSHLLTKSFSSGVKSTPAPPIKLPGNAGYITPSSGSATPYHPYRSIAG